MVPGEYAGPVEHAFKVAGSPRGQHGSHPGKAFSVAGSTDSTGQSVDLGSRRDAENARRSEEAHVVS